MLLITIAHKGEALEFIRRKHTLKADFYFSGLYRHDQELLLLTGDKPDNVKARVCAVFDYFGNKISNVLNFGIAGGLDRELQLNQIYGVKRVVFESGQEYITTDNRRGQVVCMTVLKPVMNDHYATQLSPRAQVVDQELWDLAQICREYNIGLKSYKLISDYAGSETDTALIRSNKELYSRHLFDFYKKLPGYTAI
jgi:nucleoside phosphorylase